jgi:RNA polymerase sigma factor (sigma-70 family)
MATAHIDTAIRQLRQAALRQDEAERADSQLLASFIDQKDEAAFEALVRRHGAMVFGVCRRVARNHHDAEDAFQATFLVLARKAATVRPREKLACWLHGVALRTAMKAQTLAAKRSVRERQVAEMPEPEATVAPQDPWRDLQPLLDQELNGLPENYRLPILLCDLEGKSIKEATRQLGWPQGTLAGRLARGRKLLARRLTNRGVALSAGTLAAVVSQNSASAAVPTPLLCSTVKTAAALAAGQVTAAGAAPARVAVLTEGVLKAMLLNKLKNALATLLLIAALIGAAGAAVYQTQAAEQPKDEQKNTTGGAPAPPVLPNPPKVENPREYVIKSRVMEAGSDRPTNLAKMVLEDGQALPSPLHLSDGPQNLLAKVIDDEKIKVGTLLDVRVKHLSGNKVRLFVSFQKNEIEKADVSEIRVIGSSVQCIQDVELTKPVKIVFQKDAKGPARRWLEITVDPFNVNEQPVPPPALQAQPDR